MMIQKYFAVYISLFLLVLGCASKDDQPICTKSCPTNMILNIDTCSCEIKPCTISCDEGYSVNEETCNCEKDPCTITCDSGYSLNQETCSCEKDPCTITCESGYTKNEETCACDKDPEQEKSIPLCEGVTQPTPKMLSNATSEEINAKCGTFIEENGLLIMEAENTTSDYSLTENKWVFKDASTTVVESGFAKSNCNIVSKVITDHKGSGYLYFNTGDYWSVYSDKDKLAEFQKNNSLTYTFTIKNSGNYRLFLRSLKAIDYRNNECRGDSYNDCFIKMEGDFEAGEVYSSADCVNTNGYVAPTKYMLSDFKKFFGASNQKWTTTGKLDNHNTKPWAIYELKAGQTYTLTISGRSKNFMIDRIMLVDLHKYNYNQFNNYLNNAVQNSCE